MRIFWFIAIVALFSGCSDNASAKPSEGSGTAPSSPTAQPPIRSETVTLLTEQILDIVSDIASGTLKKGQNNEKYVAKLDAMIEIFRESSKRERVEAFTSAILTMMENGQFEIFIQGVKLSEEDRKLELALKQADPSTRDAFAHQLAEVIVTGFESAIAEKKSRNIRG